MVGVTFSAAHTDTIPCTTRLSPMCVPVVSYLTTTADGGSKMAE